MPNDAAIKAPFADVLVGAMRVLDAPADPCLRCGQLVCTCPPRPRAPRPWDPAEKICSGCGHPWRICTSDCERCGLTRATGCVCYRAENYRVDVEVVGEGEVVHVSVDGAEIDLHIVHALHGALDQMGIPEVHLEQAAAALQQQIRNDPMTFLTALRGQDQGQQ